MSLPAEPSTGSLFTRLLPILSAMLAAFLVTGMAIPVIPLHVHHDLGFGTFVVGLVAGSQFAAALLSRFWSGAYSDRRGPKRAVVAGLLMAAGSGVLYLLSLAFVSTPVVSAAVLLAGRAVLGGGESFIVTGALSWGFALAGTGNAGMVMSWIGTALWASFAAGAPAGNALYALFGFPGVAIATLLVPFLPLVLVLRLPGTEPSAAEHPSVRQVLGAIWVPGLGVALSSIAFGTIATFSALLFAERGWSHAWLAFTSLAAAFILGRIVFGHLPDRIGGAQVALVCVLIEATGQAIIWIARTPTLVFVGAAVTGLGYSLVYPGFGLEAVARTPPQSRGLAMGAFTAFLDLALGIVNPALGFLASRAGLTSLYLAGAITVLGAAPVAVSLLRPPTERAHDGAVDSAAAGHTL
ncbi:MAG TPA: arabinose transporter [Candidatus Polarisedimenticolia bacterium]|jgi:MFS family permease|nr:arabinose transporter [Candidatus Polarisedimenticolia bacterium]